MRTAGSDSSSRESHKKYSPVYGHIALSSVMRHSFLISRVSTQGTEYYSIYIQK